MKSVYIVTGSTWTSKVNFVIAVFSTYDAAELYISKAENRIKRSFEKLTITKWEIDTDRPKTETEFYQKMSYEKEVSY